MKKIIVTCLGTAFVLASLGVVPIASAMPETAGTTPRDIVSNVEKLDAINEADEWTVMTENDTLRLEVNKSNGQIALCDKNAAYTWYSNPPDTENDEELNKSKRNLMSEQLEISFYDTRYKIQDRNSQLASVNRDGLRYRMDGNTITFYNEFVKEGFEIPVRYELQDEYLSVQIPLEEIRHTSENGTLASVSLLPYFGCADTQEEGYFLVPDGSGALVRFNNGKSNTAEYSQPIYGSDRLTSPELCDDTPQKAHLPVLGLYKEQQGLLMVTTDGDVFASANAYVSGMKKIYNAAYFSFSTWPSEKLSIETNQERSTNLVQYANEPYAVRQYEVRYYPLGADAGYVEMATRYRQYLAEEKGMGRTDTSDAFLSVTSYGAVNKTGSFCWIPYQKTMPLTTYADAQTLIRSLRDAGADKVSLQYKAWTKGGLTGKIAVKGKLESCLGSRKDFRELMGLAEKDRAVRLTMDINASQLYTEGNGFTKSRNAVRTLSGAPSLQFTYDVQSFLRSERLGGWYLVSPSSYASIAQAAITSYQLGSVGLSLGDAGSFLVSDYAQGVHDRSETADMTIQALKKVRELGKVPILDGANAYLFPYIDEVLDAPMTDSHFSIEDESVPFYPIVLSGYKRYTSDALNLRWSTEALLQTLEYGAAPHFILNGRNESLTKETHIEWVYNSAYTSWTKEAAEAYQAYARVLAVTKGSAIVGHSRPQNGVAITLYENGAQVVVNYNEQPITVDGMQIEAQSFAVRG